MYWWVLLNTITLKGIKCILMISEHILLNDSPGGNSPCIQTGRDFWKERKVTQSHIW